MQQNTFKLYRVFVYLALFLLAVSIVVPILWVLMASLKSEKDIVMNNPFSLPTEFLWSNFQVAWTKSKMGHYLMNSVMVTGLALLILLVVAVPASYVLARFKFMGRKVLNTLYMLGLFINVNYIALPIFVTFFNLERNIGLKNIFTENIYFLALVYAATALPFTVYLLTSFFKTLPSAYEEAASIDGCGYFSTMMRIMVPMAKPSIITVVLFQFLAFWNEYILAFTFLSKDNATLPVGLTFLMASARTASQSGVMYAGLVIAMLPTLILYVIVQKKLIEGMTIGGLKD